MTEEQIKEALSNSYVGTLACRKGYKLMKPQDTGGVDFSVTYDVEYNWYGRKRSTQSGKYIELQLKATTEKAIHRTNKGIKYDLDSKNFDDLITRKERGNTPLILILFILPTDNEDWVGVYDDELILRKHAYWYYPDDSSQKSENRSSVRIEIPHENKLNLDSFSMLFEKYG